MMRAEPGPLPGDQEDLQGGPIVGPAGRRLREVMQELGEALEDCYVTNPVKHFNFVARGKRRLHQNLSATEVDSCRWWLGRETDLVRPKVVIVSDDLLCAV
ncbi:MAG: hypothetical protein OXR62_00810 [Ahrensia sp.]|nr:hypothetical protein [Ahrensia sp.]